MARGTDDRIASAIAAAADQVLSRPLPPPEATSSRVACTEAGVGLSRFYRVFTSADEFRRSVAIHHLEAIYGLIERGVDVDVANLDYRTATAAAGPVDDASFEEVIRDWSHAVLRQILDLAAERGSVPPVEADYLPWSDDEAITAAIRYSFSADLDRYDGYPEAVSSMTGRRLVADPDEVIQRFTMSTLAGLFHRAVDEIVGADEGADAIPVSAELQAALAGVLYLAE